MRNVGIGDISEIGETANPSGDIAQCGETARRKGTSVVAMSDASVDRLKQAVESQHGGTATFVQAVPVHETHNGETVWDGVVHIFDLRNHPDGAWRAYAWLDERDAGKHRFFAVLHTPQIDGPRKAVAAAIVMESRSKEAW